MCNYKTLVELDAVLGILEDEMPGHYLSKNTQVIAKLHAIQTKVVEIDIRAVMIEELEKAVGESPWVPKEYMMNEVISDCCEFLRSDRHSLKPSAVPALVEYTNYRGEKAAVLSRMGKLSQTIAYLPAETAPKDGSILRLFVDYSVKDGCGALEDAETAWTIGFNQLVDTGDDVWEFAGWDWGGDCFTQGHGKVIGWLPFHSSSVPEHAPVPRGSVQVDSDSVMNYADCSNAPLRLVAHMTKNERLALNVCDMRKAASEIQRVELDRHTAEHLAQDLAKMLELDNPTKGPNQCPQ